MSVHIVTGKLGNGKTLAAVGRIRDYLNEGRRVATNLDLYMENFRDEKNRNIHVVRLPDKPSVDDLEALGLGYDGKGYRENKFGLLVLDECGTWFNSRNWNDKSRKDVNDWFLHARKKRWDVILIIQDISLLDKQAREALAEYTVFCRRLDNLRIPIISPLIKMVTGFNPTLPRVHVGIVKYGDNATYPTADRWWYRGDDLFKLYDTQQVFLADSCGMHCYLTPWHLVGRYRHRDTLLQQITHAFERVMQRVLYIEVLAVAWVRGRSPRMQAKLWGVLKSDSHSL